MFIKLIQNRVVMLVQFSNIVKPSSPTQKQYTHARSLLPPSGNPERSPLAQAHRLNLLESDQGNVSSSIPQATPEPANVPILREYQQQVVREVYALIKKGIKRILLFSPTGSGKTLNGGGIVADAVSRGRRVLFKEDLPKSAFFRIQIIEDYRRQYAPEWASIRFRDDYELYPPDNLRRTAIFGNNPSEQDQADYWRFLIATARRKEKPQAWVVHQWHQEFGFGGGLANG